MNITENQRYESLPTFRDEIEDQNIDITAILSSNRRRRESPEFHRVCNEEFKEYVRSKSKEKTALLNIRDKKLTVVNSQDSLLEEEDPADD